MPFFVSYSHIVNNLLLFWRQHPALLSGLSLLLGFCFAFNNFFLVIVPLCFLWLPFILQICITQSFKSFQEIALSFCLLIGSFTYGSWHYQHPDLPFEGIKGTAYLDVDSLQIKTSYFSNSWLYGCQLKSFVPDDSSASDTPITSAASFVPIAKHVKCSTSIPKKCPLLRPLANQSYCVRGILKKTEKGTYFLKTRRRDHWHPIAYSWSLAELRFQAKRELKEWIHRHISRPKSATFLAGLATGEFDDRALAIDFGRFGLQHIMAISGFHFAIIAAILGFFFRFFLSFKINAIVIICLLSLYFFFLGTSASILRSWTMISIAMMGFCIEKSPNALNSLGIAMIITLLVDPLLSQTMGFQLSFLTTAAILLLFASTDDALTFLLTKRVLSQMVKMNGWNQHAYLILCFFRQGIALTVAVNIFAVPALLYYFNQFPLMSLLYNLFFPLLVTGSMLMLILGFFIPGLGHINSVYTEWVLDFTQHMPTSVDVYFRTENFPAWLLIIYLSAVGTGSVILKQRQKEVGKDKRDFAFL